MDAAPIWFVFSLGLAGVEANAKSISEESKARRGVFSLIIVFRRVLGLHGPDL
jgi:hypothetical protein